MRFYEADAVIAATPAAVWAILVDGAKWSAWDSGVDGVQGSIAAGEKVTIRSKVAPGRAFPVQVTTFDAPRRLQFTGGMPLGLFRGVRTYDLTLNAAGGTDVRMREVYSGLMAPMIFRSIPDLTASFATFTAGLTARVESVR